MDLNFPAILVTLVFVTGGIWLIDALMFAPRRRSVATQEAENGTSQEDIAHSTREPLLVEYARSFFPVILVVLVLRSFIFEPFRIPSSSMMPTLLIGDFILVNKYAYGVRLPVINTKVIEAGSPERGDVAVFRFPLDPSIDYIKRVVGVPGDQIWYQDKVLYINGKPALQTSIGTYTGIGSGESATGSLHSMEMVADVEHAILIETAAPDFPYRCQVLLRGPVMVPPDSFFVMGDNRDHSSDSRCWGFVPEKNLVGKAFGIWMSWDWDRPDFPVAWERLAEGID
ncbi:Signal peptidase I [hydrothermal vent metagenome]|uniref:signal peptidase I n=1 Tax=hydrothermal vent metagenome TaxID=652676 RepID=A0A3B1BEY2_9ZZZZ